MQTNQPQAQRARTFITRRHSFACVLQNGHGNATSLQVFAYVLETTHHTLGGELILGLPPISILACSEGHLHLCAEQVRVHFPSPHVQRNLHFIVVRVRFPSPLPPSPKCPTLPCDPVSPFLSRPPRSSAMLRFSCSPWLYFHATASTMPSAPDVSRHRRPLFHLTRARSLQVTLTCFYHWELLLAALTWCSPESIPCCLCRAS